MYNLIFMNHKYQWLQSSIKVPIVLLRVAVTLVYYPEGFSPKANKLMSLKHELRQGTSIDN